MIKWFDDKSTDGVNRENGINREKAAKQKTVTWGNRFFELFCWSLGNLKNWGWAIYIHTIGVELYVYSSTPIFWISKGPTK